MRHARLLLLLGAVGCAPDLRADFPFDGQVGDGPLVQVEPQEDGSRRVLVDATNKGSQVYFDMDEGVELKVDEAFASNGRDLAFQRYTVSINGGASSPTGSVRVAALKGVAWESLTTAPAEGYRQDAAETVFNEFEGGWYYYDLTKHRLLTRGELLYVVQSSQGRFYKVQMLSYYDEAGTPARLSLRYQELPASGVAP